MNVYICFNPDKIEKNELFIEKLTEDKHLKFSVISNKNDIDDVKKAYYSCHKEELLQEEEEEEELLQQEEILHNFHSFLYNKDEEYRYYDSIIIIQENEITLFATMDFVNLYEPTFLRIGSMCQNKINLNIQQQLINISKYTQQLFNFSSIVYDNCLSKYENLYIENGFISGNDGMVYKDDNKKISFNLKNNENIILALNPSIEKNKFIIQKLLEIDIPNVLITNNNNDYNNIKNRIISGMNEGDELCKKLQFNADSLQQGNFDGIVLIYDKNTNKTYGIETIFFEHYDRNYDLYILNLCSNKNIENLYGIGSTLINFTKKIIRHLDYKTISLGSNLNAIGFYKKQGFKFTKFMYMEYFPVKKGGYKNKRKTKRRKRTYRR